MSVGRNVTIRRAWAPGKTGMSDGYGRQVDMGTGRNGATVEMRMPGKHGRRAKYEHHVGMVSVETGHRSKYDHRANIGAERNGAPVKHGRQVGMDARQTWAPGRHGRRSKREHRSKRWLVSARLWASLLSGRLVEPHGFRLLGGCPNHIFGIAIVNWKADRLISCCSGDRRQFEG